MATVESLARLTSGSINPATSGGRSTANNALSSAEIAGLLSGLNKEQMTFALAKYTLDDRAVEQLIITTRMQTLRISQRGKWKIRPSQLKALADIATAESLNPNRCKRCNGIGRAANKACVSCSGTGFKRLSNRKIAEAVDVPETSFRRDWKDRLCAVLEYVYSLDNAVRFRVSINSRND